MQVVTLAMERLDKLPVRPNKRNTLFKADNFVKPNQTRILCPLWVQRFGWQQRRWLI